MVDAEGGTYVVGLMMGRLLLARTVVEPAADPDVVGKWWTQSWHEEDETLSQHLVQVGDGFFAAPGVVSGTI